MRAIVVPIFVLVALSAFPSPAAAGLPSPTDHRPVMCADWGNTEFEPFCLMSDGTICPEADTPAEQCFPFTLVRLVRDRLP